MVNELFWSEALDDKESAVRLKRERESKPAAAKVERYSGSFALPARWGKAWLLSPAARLILDAGVVWDGLSEGVTVRGTEREK